MSHLLSVLIIQSTNKHVSLSLLFITLETLLLSQVDFMVQQGGLGGSCRHNCDLRRSAENSGHDQEARQTYSVAVEQENLHLGSRTAGAVPDRDHLADVAGDSLNDVHDGSLFLSQSRGRTDGNQ